jgi:hypothetical protein
MFRIYLTLTGLAGYLTDSYTRLRDEEDGLTTTEIAVVTFLLVGAAIVVMGIIYVAARNNADNIPVPQAPA